MPNKDFFRTFLDDLADPDTSIVADGKSAAEFSKFIDTGSYAFNALLSGSVYGGFPDNKGIVLAGDPATGKTFYALGIVKYFLEANPGGRVFYFDTESAITREMFVARGIDVDRVAISEPETLEAFRTKAIKLLDQYLALDVDKRFPALLVLDSLSMLPSVKEMADTTEGNNTRDMTKAPVIKSIFRTLRLKMARAKIPMVVTSHVYAVIGSYVPTKEVAGGSGAKYASDTIVLFSKSKVKDDDKHLIGNIIKATAAKSRFTREGTQVETRIMFNGGLDRYFGLLSIAVDAGIVKKGTKYEFPDGSKAFEKAILKTPEKYFTKAVLDAIDVYVGKNFKYVGVGEEPVEEADDVE